MSPASTSPSLRQFLAHVDPFKVLPGVELDRLVNLTVEKTYGKGETIYSEDDAADSVWILRTGRIQIFKNISGHPQAIESLGPEELFGTLCRLGGDGRTYPCTAVASTPCSVIRILDTTFLDFYNRFPALVMGVCSLCSQRLKAVQGISCSAQEPVDRRIGNILLKLREAHGNTLPFTKREISELVGATVETTIRTVSSFARKGWVSSARGKIILKAPTEIRKLVDSAC